MKKSKKQTAPIKFLEAMREFQNPKMRFGETPVRLLYMYGFENVRGQNPYRVFYTNTISSGELIATA